MKRHRYSLIPTLATLLVAFAVFTAAPLFGATTQVLYNFSGQPDGGNPWAGLIFDAAGSLYGTTSTGGPGGGGTVFKLSPGAGGKWTETTLYSFTGQNGDGDGYAPYGGLIFDSLGNLYGTTAGCSQVNCGTVFELSPTQGGKWTETILHSFNGQDGSVPLYSALIFDAAGNLYGTTIYGGSSGTRCDGHGCGTVFELSFSNGTWSETVLYNFCSAQNCADGAFPAASLVFDANGNLYGTTSDGGARACDRGGCGTVFELINNKGTWTESVLVRFDGKTGGVPFSSLIFDASGNLYGTTVKGGGRPPRGLVFELSPSHGTWTETVLHEFKKHKNGQFPYAGVLFDATGNLYGITSDGGVSSYFDHGVAFKLVPQAGGKWKQISLFRFHGQYGTGPYGNLIFDAAGNLYGTTYRDGASGFGTVFEITP
jgi:uncharacterized repeat protein (TIGR03803 family)